MASLEQLPAEVCFRIADYLYFSGDLVALARSSKALYVRLKSTLQDSLVVELARYQRTKATDWLKRTVLGLLHNAEHAKAIKYFDVALLQTNRQSELAMHAINAAGYPQFEQLSDDWEMVWSALRVVWKQPVLDSEAQSSLLQQDVSRLVQQLATGDGEAWFVLLICLLPSLRSLTLSSPRSRFNTEWYRVLQHSQHGFIGLRQVDIFCNSDRPKKMFGFLAALPHLDALTLRALQDFTVQCLCNWPSTPYHECTQPLPKLRSGMTLTLIDAELSEESFFALLEAFSDLRGFSWVNDGPSVDDLTAKRLVGALQVQQPALRRLTFDTAMTCPSRCLEERASGALDTLNVFSSLEELDVVLDTFFDHSFDSEICAYCAHEEPDACPDAELANGTEIAVDRGLENGYSTVALASLLPSSLKVLRISLRRTQLLTMTRFAQAVRHQLPLLDSVVVSVRRWKIGDPELDARKSLEGLQSAMEEASFRSYTPRLSHEGDREILNCDFRKGIKS